MFLKIRNMENFGILWFQIPKFLLLYCLKYLSIVGLVRQVQNLLPSSLLSSFQRVKGPRRSYKFLQECDWTLYLSLLLISHWRLTVVLVTRPVLGAKDHGKCSIYAVCLPGYGSSNIMKKRGQQVVAAVDRNSPILEIHKLSSTKVKDKVSDVIAQSWQNQLQKVSNSDMMERLWTQTDTSQNCHLAYYSL